MIHTKWMRIASIVLVSFQAAASADSSDAPTPGDVAQALGFSTAEIRRIERGDVISKPMNEGSDNELAGVVAVLFRKPLAELVDLAMRGITLETDEDVLAFRSWQPADPPGRAFSELGLAAHEASEAKRFTQASPGDKLNLSDSEISSFRNVQPTPEAVNVPLRAMLEARYLAYLQEGFKAITPYKRVGARSCPADELKLAIRETMTSAPRSDFFSALFTYPAKQPSDIEHKFYWIKQNVEDRPAFVLAHVSMRRSERGAIITEQQFYVSHSYNSNFVASGCLSVEGGGTLVFYVNRTFTDQVAGLGAGAKHRIGRGRMLSEVAEKLKRTRDSIHQ